MEKSLAEQMKDVVDYLSQLYEGQVADGTENHAELCHSAASRFRLYERLGKGEAFPLWLSRVAQGVMNDVEEKRNR